MVTALWDKHAVLRCLAIGISMDANRDGIGDFQGLMRRRDALHGLASPPCG
jgi:maltose alpha-D-glucosyltransferase/alpha-amylase